MFDQSFLPDAEFEFVLLPDTHYMLDAESVEFESRRQQTGRTARALELVEALDPEFVVHLGDVVQEFPGSDTFETAVVEANRQLDTLDVEVYHVAGNHDVGDKPDPTMPTQPVTSASLEAYHDRYGQSWYSWDHGGVHFVVLNSQLLNSSLPAAETQQTWLEEDLQATIDGLVVLFLHLPPFLHRPDEPAIGHYDNVGLPAREWLLGLLQEHSIDRLFAAHTHFSFRNRVGDTRLRVAPSPSFTRPGFGELFSSCPPPEQGRDDRGKLGFYLVRVVDGEACIHHVRTHGEMGADPSIAGDRLLTRTLTGTRSSPLGASLLHPLTESARVPATFPSAIQREVHNDYPALACLGIGVNYIRTPVWGRDDELLTRTANDLRADGVTVVGTILAGAEPQFTVEEVPIDAFDTIEVCTPGTPLPTDKDLRAVDAYRGADRPVSLSTVVPERTVEGKQHDRLRGAFSASDLERLDDRLAAAGTRVERVLRWVGIDADPWSRVGEGPSPASLSHVDAVDWQIPTTGTDERRAVDRAGRALFAVAPLTDSRLYLEPLREMDRTMDRAPGLLDRRCNPTSVFHAVRALNTILFGEERRWRRGPERTIDGVTFLGLECADLDVWLALPPTGSDPIPLDLPGGTRSTRRRWTVSLMDATSRSGSLDGDAPTTVEVNGPTLVAVETGNDSAL